MPCLIHLNGPPGIGKSTLAAMYADDHPGVLNLDIDQLRCMIGGWRGRFAETGEIVRPLALSMAATHLAAGRDVILPQFLGRLSELARFERAAHRSGATFREFVLMDTREQSAARFLRRAADDPSPWHQHVHDTVERLGGASYLAASHDQLTALIAARPGATVIPSAAGTPAQTYQALIEALAAQA